MIYITGDVHSRDLKNWESLHSKSNLKASLRYLQILKKNKLSCTLFINGICLDEEYSDVKKLLSFDVEWGGHTYNNFGSMGKVKSYLYRKKFGSIYGPFNFQKKDIIKTKSSFERRGIKMTSWRTHAFGSSKKTFKILRSQGVEYVSDLLGEVIPFRENGLNHIPINIPVDQNTIAYGPLKPENLDPFASCTKGRIRPREWLDIVKKRIIENEKKNIDSVLLLHPATMAYIEDYRLFEDLCKFLSKYKSKKISEYPA